MPWYDFLEGEVDNHLIEDKRGGQAQKHRNPKRHILPVSSLLWHKMVAVHCFVWPLSLQL